MSWRGSVEFALAAHIDTYSYKKGHKEQNMSLTKERRDLQYCNSAFLIRS